MKFALAWGKSFCMLYAVIGIPLCLVMFQSVGERLNNFASWCIKTIKKCLKCRFYDSTQTELVIVGTVLAVGVVTGGAAMFHHYEAWGYFNCVYYCFITLTTIGEPLAGKESSQLKTCCRCCFLLFRFR